MLWVAREGDPYSAATRETLARAGVELEILDSHELARRYPQMRFDEPRYTASWSPRAV